MVIIVDHVVQQCGRGFTVKSKISTNLSKTAVQYYQIQIDVVMLALCKYTTTGSATYSSLPNYPIIHPALHNMPALHDM